MERKPPKKKVLSSYSIDAKLSDINESVILTFHQNEEFIRGKSQNNFSIRKLTFVAQSPDEQKRKFKSICDLVSTYGQKIMPFDGTETYDASYSIYNSDNKGGTSINLKMGENINNPIYVEISPFKIRAINEKS